jgi:subfamily B ATP-binding cassette protein MsbA
LTLVQTTLDAAVPQIVKQFFDLVEKAFRTSEINLVKNSFWFYLVLFSIIIFFSDFINQTKNFYITKWWNQTRRDLSTRVFDHLQSLSIRYFETVGPGKLKERVDRGINDLNEIMQGSLMEILPQLLYIAIAVYFLFRINYIFGLTILLGIPLFVGISQYFTPKIITTQDELRNSDERASAIALESILNIRTVKSYTTEVRHTNDYRDQLNESVDLSVKYMRTRIEMNIFRFMIINLSRIIILGLGAYWALGGKITAGTLILAWAYTERSFSPLWHLTWLIDNIQKDLRSVKRVFDILDTKPTITDIPNARSLKITRGQIIFSNIDFGYENRKVLDDFYLKIQPKKVVAIVGRSGAGKSTLIRLLLRFVQPQNGQISIDRQNIANITQKSLRDRIGVVLQETALFNDTVFNNIAYANKKASKEDVVRAAKIAHADEFITKMKHGYDTIVGEAGVRLSGGEKQRISIARAVLKDAPILILDEATSALDSESEAYIQDALWQMVKGKTAIIIAHRLSTIMRADLIVVMDKGKIVEMDTHRELVKNKGLYSKLYEIQSGGYLS